MSPENNSGVEKAVEAAAEALWNEREFREPTGDEPEGWCPPGHDVHQKPPHEPFLWEQMVAEGKYEGEQEETRADARAVVDAIRPLLTQQPVLLSDEDRERLGQIAKAIEASATGEPVMHNVHVDAAFLRNLAQQHYGAEGADR